MNKKKHTFISKSKRHRFGEILISNGTVKSEQVEEALAIQREEGGILGWIMVEKGFITEGEVVRTVSEQYNLPMLRMKNFDVNSELVKFFSEKFLYVNLVVPLCEFGDFLLVCVADIPDDDVIEKMEEKGKQLVVYLTSVTDISNALNRYAPVAEDERREYLSLRRKRLTGEYSQKLEEEQNKRKQNGKQGRGGGKKSVLYETDETIATVEESALFENIDNAWETVFDIAEENLKKENEP